ncbi:HNH endonuclease [Desulfitobacterium hafniense]|uniref:HNH nuclease domain-containing protein n=1 Tax=Desulfitobacterium hafniense (strain Y51) TaxID=138119 RepID=Q24RY4_DESHY|nr:HNH endonuclease [Desulfitobacterium hafniense]BAE85208.1 hypothetical protein DSY3419 [Desulfitobacterium hafniense Y51]
MERKSISKKIRFEVYKRDKFTCQYCGRKAPDVILNIDHIEPISKNGSNDILNLITSCFDCNNGKRDIPLSQNDVLDKQRQQLEELQERREQIEMMFEWKKSLEDLDEYKIDLLADFVESKIPPYTLNETGKADLAKLFKRFELNEIFDAVDKGVKNYLKHDASGKLTKDSVETFINKLGGIAANSNRPAVEQKMHYIKGICRNRFNYWDDRKGLAILSSYIKALRNYGWTEERILDDLETQVSDLAKEAKNWSEWKGRMEQWISDIENWDKEDNPDTYEFDITEIRQIVDDINSECSWLIDLIEYIALPFGKGDIDSGLIRGAIKQYIDIQIDILINNSEDIGKLKPNHKVCKDMHLFDYIDEIDSGLTYMIDAMYSKFIIEWVEEKLYLPSYLLSDEKDLTLFKQEFHQKFELNI